MKIHVDPRDLKLIQDTLSRHGLLETAFAFGSRVRGDHRPNSDLDIVIRQGRPLEIGILARLETEFSESSLGYKVEIVDWPMISEEFRKRIAADLVPLARVT